MKNKLAQLLMLVVLTVGFAAFASAQTGSTHRATIPFDFIVGDNTYKAGEYVVKFGVSASLGNNVLLRSADGKKSAIINQTVSKSSSGNAREGNFVFYVANGHYYLAEINTAYRSVKLRGSHLSRAKAKRYELALTKKKADKQS